MKKIEAIINPAQVDQIKKALLEIGIRRIETTEVKGFGLQNAHTEVYRGRGYTVDYAREVKLELVVKDEQLESAAAILNNAASEKDGEDNTLLVFPIETGLSQAVSGTRG